MRKTVFLKRKRMQFNKFNYKKIPDSKQNRVDISYKYFSSEKESAFKKTYFFVI